MATWAKGVDFKNSGNTARVGGVGIYGTDGTAQKAYLAVGAEPWNSKGLEVTTSAISFMGNKVYHAGSKPTPAEIGAAASSHGTHVTYSTTAPLANGTASAGSASTVARTDHVHPLQTTVSGNAGTATKLATARTINGTSFDGSGNITTANWGTARTITIGSTAKSVNGSANVAWTLSEIGAAAASHSHSNYASTSHTHNSLEATDLSNKTVSLNDYNLSSGSPKVAYYICPSDGGGSNITGRPNDSTKQAFSLRVEVLRFASTTDYITKQTYIMGAQKIMYVRYCTNGTWTAWEKVYTSAQKPTASEIGAAASSHTHNYAGSSSAGGNANAAVKLATARTINGTSFDGTGNITTANWGTARNITIGSTTKSVNGSGNVAWTLSEIGAAAASHSHSYAPIANAVQRWNCGIKCATWSRLLYLTGNTTVGHSFILNIQGTRSSIVFNASFLVNTSHPSVASIVQLNNTKYSNFQIRVVTNSNGEAYVEVYDNANSATNSTTQTLNVSFTALSGIGAGTLTKYTSFTDGSTLASGFTVAHTITTVSGSHYSGNAATATQLQNARTINGTSFNGTANITTANWGTARNIYIADNSVTNTGPAVSVNGSGNATLKLPATIKASLSGNASTATKATQDSAGQQINTTYIKGLSISGKTITFTKGDGTTGTLTTQDTNTTYSVGTASALGLTKLYTGTGTATDGTMTQAAINSALGGKANSSHTHSSLTGATGSTIAPSTGTGVMRYDYNVSSSNAGSLPNSNNANGILTLNTHSGNYYNQLGFSSNGNLYYRAFNGVALDTTTAWKQIAFTNSSITGNAATATTLQTARTINGTSFNGSGNITTANWGTARNIYIADNSATNTGPAVSVNGSGNATLKLPATIKASLTGNATTATTLATARTISLSGAVTGSASFNGSANITIATTENLSSNLTTITKSLKVTTSWADTGITGTNLSTGTYAVQMLVNDGTNAGQYQEHYSGIMSWFADATNSTDADEILLHKAGHASNGRHVYLRTIRSGSSGRLKLQISATNAFTAASSIVFKFKRLI